jgi:D-serine deaminase-like pyridoxal phosphate-dependent protein
METRRTFLTAAGAGILAPAVAGAATPRRAPGILAAVGRGYSHAELEKKVAQRDFRGLTKIDLPTPVLVVDKEIFDHNLRTMSEHCKATGLKLRAHVKVHRSADIAKQQVAAGAIGLCCATISECELMVNAGLPGILWTCQPAGPNKFSRIVALTRKDPTFMFVVEDPRIADQLDELAAAEKVKFNVVVDIDVGIGRQGVTTPQEALELSQRVTKAKNLNLAGLMGYSGAASHTKGWEERHQVSRQEVSKLLESVELCRKAGIPVGIVTGGSTGTYNIDSENKGMTELQAGSYILMDSVYSRIGSRDGNSAYHDFGTALTVLTTVISKHYPNSASIDAGNKSNTQPTDIAKGRPGVQVERAGAEYGKLKWEGTPDREPKLGDQVELIPSNLDISVNMFDRMFVCQGDQVVDVYSILGRQGPSQR